jgi:hypothetical protein
LNKLNGACQLARKQEVILYHQELSLNLKIKDGVYNLIVDTYYDHGRTWKEIILYFRHLSDSDVETESNYGETHGKLHEAISSLAVKSEKSLFLEGVETRVARCSNSGGWDIPVVGGNEMVVFCIPYGTPVAEETEWRRQLYMYYISERDGTVPITWSRHR